MCYFMIAGYYACCRAVSACICKGRGPAFCIAAAVVWLIFLGGTEAAGHPPESCRDLPVACSHQRSGSDKYIGAAGIYVLFDDGKNVRLLYELEVPLYPQEAQEQLGIHKTGDYSVQVRVRQSLLPLSLDACFTGIQRIPVLSPWHALACARPENTANPSQDGASPPNIATSTPVYLNFLVALCCQSGVLGHPKA